MAICSLYDKEPSESCLGCISSCISAQKGSTYLALEYKVEFTDDRDSKNILVWKDEVIKQSQEKTVRRALHPKENGGSSRILCKIEFARILSQWGKGGREGPTLDFPLTTEQKWANILKFIKNLYGWNHTVETSN